MFDPDEVAVAELDSGVVEAVVAVLLAAVDAAAAVLVLVVPPFGGIAFLRTDWTIWLMKSCGTLAPSIDIAVALPFPATPLLPAPITVTEGSISIPTIIGSTFTSTSPTV